jgi:hypothetical protein
MFVEESRNVTEQQWLARGTNPTWMVNAIRHRLPDRKLRLFAVACVRSILLQARAVHQGEVARVAEIAERFAEGTATARELEAARRDAIPWDREISAATEACNLEARFAAVRTVRAAADAVLGFWLDAHPEHRRRSPEAAAARRVELERQTALARCVFGNPFRPVAMAPEWRTATVLALAQGAYVEGAFDRLPILADALEEAGCSDAELLEHCRGPDPHALGCWALDLVLAKE